MAMRTVALSLLLSIPTPAHAPTRAAAAVPVHTTPPALPEPSEALWALLEAAEPVKSGEVGGVIAARRVETRSEIEALICSFDWPCAQALRVARCESTLNPRAVNSSGHAGLFQLSPRFHAWRVGGDASRLLNAEENVRAAHGLWLDSGRSWRPWSCRPN